MLHACSKHFDIFEEKHAFSTIKGGDSGCIGFSFVFAATDFLNVSYDPTRELYENFNKNLARTGNSVLVKMSILNNHMAVQVNKLVR
jgi:ABC-type sulfate transport system substrate-binding protein